MYKENSLELVINKRIYKLFIDYAINTCDSFSLVFSKKDKQEYTFQDLLNNWNNFILDIKTVNTHTDTGTDISGGSIIYFKCDNIIKNLLFSASNIYDWNGDSLPEELCFYRNKKLWFKSITHEKLSFIVSANDNDKQFLKENNFEYWYCIKE